MKFCWNEILFKCGSPICIHPIFPSFQVPLVIFKREKEISRMLEFDGIWIAEQPPDDGLRSQWDKLVLPTPSFPHMYWDKFVKKKVLKKYREQYDQRQIMRLLGMKTGSASSGSNSSKDRPEETTSSWFYSTWLQEMDLQYLLWKWGVIFTDHVSKSKCLCLLDRSLRFIS